MKGRHVTLGSPVTCLVLLLRWGLERTPREGEKDTLLSLVSLSCVCRDDVSWLRLRLQEQFREICVLLRFLIAQLNNK
ncbi:hypothetical protein E2C01_074351 [Portunus trituberculatus]|uniref:Uncharacterized protein n=1 Tax=Portunus trituberculatus TaxID=210409 RepID=A0A5B7IC67_PORTR|nr:hypothetical protein [Portunus trituberculatus]